MIVGAVEFERRSRVIKCKLLFLLRPLMEEQLGKVCRSKSSKETLGSVRDFKNQTLSTQSLDTAVDYE